MKIKVNGDQKDITEGISVAALLEELGINAELVAVEVNLDIIAKDDRGSKILSEGDEIEIVNFVGGGGLPAADHPKKVTL